MDTGIRIVSDIPKLGRMHKADESVNFEHASNSTTSFIRQCKRANLVILEETDHRFYLACALRRVMDFTLVCVDPVLPNPTPNNGTFSTIKHELRCRLLRSVDRFIVYFREHGGLSRSYGLDAHRIIYVPFKANDIGDVPYISEGDYVLCAGRSRRDLLTLSAAMAKTQLPGVLVQQPAALLLEHGTRMVDATTLPPNIRIVVDDDGQKLAQWLAGARLLVIPRFPGDINATGISLCLSAMALGKCVIISRGPGADDVLLAGEAAFVEPGDSEQLADVITELYANDAHRAEIALAGQRYARKLGDEDRLLRDVLAASLAAFQQVTDGAPSSSAANTSPASPASR